MSAGTANANSKSTVTSTSICHHLNDSHPPVSCNITNVLSSSPPNSTTAAAGTVVAPPKFDCQVSMTISPSEPPRPDSPTSLEDSQSESGLDSFLPSALADSSLSNGVADATSSSSFVSSLPSSDLMGPSTTHTRHCSKAAHVSSSDIAAICITASSAAVGMDFNTTSVDDRNMTIHTGLAVSSPMSPSQVATPPLSPSIEEEENDSESVGANGTSTSQNYKDSEKQVIEQHLLSQDQESQEMGHGKEGTALPNDPIAPVQRPPQRSAESTADHEENQQQCHHGEQQQQQQQQYLHQHQVHGQSKMDDGAKATQIQLPSTLRPNAATTVTKGTSSASVHAKAVSGPIPRMPPVIAPKSIVPPLSAWANLLPGVAPVPVQQPPAPVQPPTKPKSTHFSSSSSGSSSYPRSTANDRRIHDLIPIVLPHDCEAKLTMEMIDLFETLLPTEESHARRTQLIQKIKAIMDEEWPEEDIQVHPFGSTENDLGTSSSDVDLCITTSPTSQLKTVQQLAAAFRRHGMQRVFCVPRAKVPIVKLWDADLHLSCDMNINNTLALVNTRMIKTYVAIDPRVRPFAMIIKHWARRRVLNDAANGGTISTYTWICIVINFLQMRSPPILPALHKIPHVLSPDNQVINGNNTSFCEDLGQLEGFGLANKETLGGLLYAFFRRYAIEFDYDHHVISIREGSYLTKESKNWHIPGKQYKLLCVEEPLDTTRNLGNSSDMASTKGLREEFRRALDILHQRGSLHQVCQQWVFPPSYYHTLPRKGGPYNPNNYTPGRRYTYGYRSHNYYDDGHYYDDDDDDDEENENDFPEIPLRGDPSSLSPSQGSTNAKTVSSLLGITFKKRSNSVSSASTSGQHGSGSSHSNNNAKGGSQSTTKGMQSTKDRSTSRSRRNSSASLMAGETSGGRTRSSKPTGDETSSISPSLKSGAAQSTGSSSFRSAGGSNGGSNKGNGDKAGSVAAGTGANRSSRRQKSGESGNNNGSNNSSGRRSGGVNGGSSNSGSHRAPRATVEFNLAEIASAAPKLISRARAEAASRQPEGIGAGSGSGGEDGTNGSSATGGGGGGTSGSEGGSSSMHGCNSSKKQKSRRHHNVVWSTNSNRGETPSSRSNNGVSRNGAHHQQLHHAANGGETEKAKPIFIVAGNDFVAISRPRSKSPPRVSQDMLPHTSVDTDPAAALPESMWRQ